MDIIEEALKDKDVSKRREKMGTTEDGTQIGLRKMQMEDALATWKVCVYIHGVGPPDAKEDNLSAKEAEELFFELVEKHFK